MAQDRSDKFILGLVMAAALSLGASCAKNKNSLAFSEEQASETPSNPQPADQPTTAPTLVFETTVKPSETSTPLDLVWVIDNSGSMNEEAAHVRNNFTGFINGVAAKTDVHVALISQAGTSGTAVSLPFSGANFLQLDSGVGSTNGLAKAAQAICRSDEACDLASGSVKSGHWTNPVEGALTSFLRSNSKKVFIFVTDDDSYFDAEDFLDVYDDAYGGKPVVFGFVGKGASASPCQATTGTVYTALADATGGATYNICNADWTSTFNKLSENVVKIALGTIALPEAVKTAKTVKVKVNGVVLPSSKYTIDNAGLRLADSVLNGAAEYKLRIDYTKK